MSSQCLGADAGLGAAWPFLPSSGDGAPHDGHFCYRQNQAPTRGKGQLGRAIGPAPLPDTVGFDWMEAGAEHRIIERNRRAIRKAPEDTLVKLATPPEETISVAPASTVVLSASPPDSTMSSFPAPLMVRKLLVTPETVMVVMDRCSLQLRVTTNGEVFPQGYQGGGRTRSR